MDENFQKHEQWMVNNLMLETIVGSHAYGCQTDKSDFCEQSIKNLRLIEGWI